MKEVHSPNTDELKEACHNVDKADHKTAEFREDPSGMIAHCKISSKEGDTDARVSMKEGAGQLKVKTYKDGRSPVINEMTVGGSKRAKITGLENSGVMKIQQKDLSADIGKEWSETRIR